MRQLTSGTRKLIIKPRPWAALHPFVERHTVLQSLSVLEQLAVAADTEITMEYNF
jgi:hypothetical protein